MHYIRIKVNLCQVEQITLTLITHVKTYLTVIELPMSRNHFVPRILILDRAAGCITVKNAPHKR